MNHYDDLQRFKEKTRTHSLPFKDLSSETGAGEKGDWVILNQLVPAEEASSLAIGGSVSLPLPQRVPADMFHQVERAAVQTAQVASSVTLSVMIPGLVAPSAPQSVPAMSHIAPVAVEPVAQAGKDASRQAVSQPAAALSDHVSAPAARSRPAIAPIAEGFAHLFAAKDKALPLKSLLERIATCR
jgi:hypothetical protein